MRDMIDSSVTIVALVSIKIDAAAHVDYIIMFRHNWQVLSLVCGVRPSVP